MARSTYIYVITRWDKPWASFTVKREAKAFLKDKMNQGFWYPKSAVLVYRMPDNPPSECLTYIFTAEGFLDD